MKGKSGRAVGTAVREAVRTVNLEAGMPTVPVAVSRLEHALREAGARRETALKLIHGYGSTGRGGVLRVEVRAALARLEREGRIAGFVPGEELSPFSAAGRLALARCPGLSRDRDYARENPGVTVVLL